MKKKQKKRPFIKLEDFDASKSTLSQCAMKNHHHYWVLVEDNEEYEIYKCKCSARKKVYKHLKEE